MNLAAETIPLERLALALVPVGVVLLILNAWSLNIRTSLTAVGRMLLQLLLLGYLLRYIFEADSSLVVMAVLSAMLLAASWISLRVSAAHRRSLYPRVLFSIIVGGGSTLLIITQGVLQLDPWYEPQKMIPLAGMIFSNSMNAVSLAIERYQSELSRGEPCGPARRTALEASLIPITNSLFAVGLVSIPGMMTGQVLSGTEPAIAARYQIMVMCMMFASAGISAALSLYLAERSGAAVPPTDAAASACLPEASEN
ncbi:MAG: ABC transporter permease [Fuerstiella sp.]